MAKEIDWEALAVFLLNNDVQELAHMLTLRSMAHSQKEKHIKTLRRALRQDFDGGDRDKMRERVFTRANEVLEEGLLYLKNVEQGKQIMSGN